MTTRLDIDLLRNFVAIADAGGLTKAAAKVGRTQSALSQQMMRLETEVQQALMIRSGRGITLTAQGERLLQHAHNILRIHDEAVGEMLGESLSGELRIGCPPDYAMTYVPPLLQKFSSQHPQVMIEVICAPTLQLLELLKAQLLDIAIVSESDHSQRDQFLRREQFVWVGAQGSDAHNREPLPLALAGPENLDSLAATSCLDRAGLKYRIAYASESLHGLTAVVKSGQAIAVLTRGAVPPQLCILPPSSGLPKLPWIGVTVKTSRRNTSKLLRTFESHVRAMLPMI